MSTSFIAAAKMGEELRLTGKALKVGKTLGFSEVTITRKSDGKLVATGKHTKAIF